MLGSGKQMLARSRPSPSAPRLLTETDSRTDEEAWLLVAQRWYHRGAAGTRILSGEREQGRPGRNRVGGSGIPALMERTDCGSTADVVGVTLKVSISSSSK